MFGAAALVLIGLSYGLTRASAPPGAVIDNYSALELAAMDRLEKLSEKGFAMAVGLVGAMGAVALGFNDKVRFDRGQLRAATLAITCCVASALAGVTLRLELISMLVNRMEPYLAADVIQRPLLAQYLALLAALAVIGWLIIDKAAKR